MIILTDKILENVIKKRPLHSYKGTYGRIVVIGGNPNYGGAVIMNALASVYGGAGLVTVATDPSNFTALHAHLPEAMVTDYHDTTHLQILIKNADVVLLGSGLGEDDTAYHVLQDTLAAVTLNQTLIIDGSALSLIALHHFPLPNTHVILTPHQMEWQRLSQIKIDDQSLERNQSALQQLFPDAVLVLKQYHTQIYHQQQVMSLTIGGPHQATGGMGDTLAGIIASFVAQFHSAKLVDCVGAAVYTHSAIADELSITQYVTLPTQISMALPIFMKKHAN